jgi:hypothetical protein
LFDKAAESVGALLGRLPHLATPFRGGIEAVSDRAFLFSRPSARELSGRDHRAGCS